MKRSLKDATLTYEETIKMTMEYKKGINKKEFLLK
jgi:hypothetical protein